MTWSTLAQNGLRLGVAASRLPARSVSNRSPAGRALKDGPDWGINLWEEVMAKKDNELYGVLRSGGLRKKVARELSDSAADAEHSRPSRSLERAVALSSAVRPWNSSGDLSTPTVARLGTRPPALVNATPPREPLPRRKQQEPAPAQSTSHQLKRAPQRRSTGQGKGSADDWLGEEGSNVWRRTTVPA